MNNTISNCRRAYNFLFAILIIGLQLIAVNISVAQLYYNASSNLPDNGAKGQTMDVRALDFDQDGDLDLILANEFQPNTILINNGSGIFSKAGPDVLPQEVHDSEDIAIADFNSDGHQDLIFCSEDDLTQGWTNVHEYYLSDGNGKFTIAPYSFPDSKANAVLAIGLNGDNHPDVIFGNEGPSRAYINKGDGTFELDATRIPGLNRTTQDLAAADVDNDGDLDIFEGNENDNVLLLNDGSGMFIDVTATHLPQGLDPETRKVTFGDIDKDGDQDVFLSNVHFIDGKDPQNRLFVNDGTGHFTDVTATQLPVDGDHTIDAIFEDVDLDSDLDIVVANVFGAPIKIYRNDGSGFFVDATDDVLGENYVRDALSVIAADLNGDNLRDLYICDRFMPQTNKKDLLLLRSPVSSVSQADKSPDDFLVYPNPLKNEFFIRSNRPVSAVRLENLQGQLVDTIPVAFHADGLYTGAVSQLKLPAGIYVFNVFELNKKVAVFIE